MQNREGEHSHQNSVCLRITEKNNVELANNGNIDGKNPFEIEHIFRGLVNRMLLLLLLYEYKPYRCTETYIYARANTHV